MNEFLKDLSRRSMSRISDFTLRIRDLRIDTNKTYLALNFKHLISNFIALIRLNQNFSYSF